MCIHDEEGPAGFCGSQVGPPSLAADPVGGGTDAIGISQYLLGLLRFNIVLADVSFVVLIPFKQQTPSPPSCSSG